MFESIDGFLVLFYKDFRFYKKKKKNPVLITLRVMTSSDRSKKLYDGILCRER